MFYKDPCDLPPAFSLSHHFPSTFPLYAFTLSSPHTALSSLIFAHAFCSLPPFLVFLLSHLRGTSSKEPLSYAETGSRALVYFWAVYHGILPCTCHSCGHLTVAFTPRRLLGSTCWTFFMAHHQYVLI